MFQSPTTRALSGDAVGTGYSLSAYPLARCLDGSYGRYYLSPGADPATVLTFHEGGGYCCSVTDCTSRASSSLGSTAADLPTRNMYT